MQHLELSVSDPHAIPRQAIPRQATSPIGRWVAAAAAEAHELCLVLDGKARIAAISQPLRQLLGVEETVMGQDVLDGVLGLQDFAEGGMLGEEEVTKIPPILALISGRLARGLLRVASSSGACTLDAVATPLRTDDGTVGSLTFFSRV